MRELQCNRALLTMAFISGAGVPMPAFELQEDSFNIRRDIIKKNIINCNKLS